MGKATVTGESGEGLYTISVDYGSEDIAARVAGYQARIDEIAPQISALESELLTESAKISNLWAAVDIAIGGYASDPTAENLKIVDDATVLALEGSKRAKAIKQALSALQIEKGNLISLKAQFEAEVVTAVKTAWCTDYTEDATGTVGTIDINGESSETLLVPGAEAPTASEGDMRDPMAMSGAAAYLNAAILPGWQKFSPTYRTGTLTAIDYENDTCAVLLDSASSAAQQLAINQASELSDVPIVYMSCNAAAFELGDSVVVQFVAQDWDDPQVIGFRSNPRPCGPKRIIIPLELISATQSTTTPVTQNRDMIKQDVQWTPCVGGQLIVVDESPRPPGWQYAGQIGSGTTTAISLKADHSTSGVISSADEYGHFETFSFDENYRIAGDPAQIDSVIKDGALATNISFDPGADTGFDIRDVTVFENTGLLLNDYRAEDRKIGFATTDTEENQDFIACSTTALEPYFEGIPSTIDIQPAGGGGAITYNLYRYFKLESFTDYPSFPTTYGGIALGYRRAS